MLDDNTNVACKTKFFTYYHIHKFLFDFVSNCSNCGMCIFLHLFFCVGSDGILFEAKQLLDNGLLPNTNSATKAIGYRQVYGYFPIHFFCSTSIYCIYLQTCLFILFNPVLG